MDRGNATVRRVRDRYQVRVRRPGTTTYVGCGTFATEQEAEDRKADLLYEMRHNIREHPQSSMTFREFSERYLAAQRNERTRRRYESILRTWVWPVVKNQPLHTLLPMDYDDVILAAQRAGHPATALMIKKVLRAILNEAVRSRQSPYPILLMRVPDRPREFPVNLDVVSMYREHLDWQERFMFDAQLATGTRGSELVGIRPCDVGWLVRPFPTITIAGQVVAGPPVRWEPSPKDNSKRVLQVAPRCADMLARYLVEVGGRPDDEPIFVNEKDGLMHSGHWGKRLAAVRDRFNLPPLTSHDLRRAYASIAHSEGVPVAVISHNLGHSKMSYTFDKYIKPLLTDGGRSAEAMERFMATLTG